LERRVEKFRSNAEAEQADLEFYRTLTPNERLDIFFQLLEEGRDEADKGFQRVYRVTKLGCD